MKAVAEWSRCCALAGVLSLGCASSTPIAAVPTHEHWVSGYAFGIWGKAELDVRDDCPTTGSDAVRIGPTWTTLLVTVVTLGIYTPREVSVRCKPAP